MNQWLRIYYFSRQREENLKSDEQAFCDQKQLRFFNAVFI